MRKLDGTKTEQEMIVDSKSRLSLSDLPWDTINIIFDYTETIHYRLFRLNRTFTKLINKRRKGLTFNQADIPTEVFFKSLAKAARTLKTLHVGVSIKFMKKTKFDEVLFRPKMLQVLDFKRFDIISENALSRIIEHSSKSLTSFTIGCKNQAFTRMMCVKLATCRNLEIVEFAS